MSDTPHPSDALEYHPPGLHSDGYVTKKMDEPTERALLLSDADRERIVDGSDGNLWMAVERTSDFYETKISGGELVLKADMQEFAKQASSIYNAAWRQVSQEERMAFCESLLKVAGVKLGT